MRSPDADSLFVDVQGPLVTFGHTVGRSLNVAVNGIWAVAPDRERTTVDVSTPAKNRSVLPPTDPVEFAFGVFEQATAEQAYFRERIREAGDRRARAARALHDRHLMTFAAIGSRVGLTPQRISQLVWELR